MHKIKDRRIRRAYIRKALRFFFSAFCLVSALVLTVLGVRHYKHNINHPLAFETLDSNGLKKQTKIDMSLGFLELEQAPEKIGKYYYLVYKKGCNNEFCVLNMDNKSYDHIVNTIAKEGKIVIEGPMDFLDSTGESEVFDFVGAYVQAYVQENNIAPKRKGKKPEDYMRDFCLCYDSERSTLSKIITTCYAFAIPAFILGPYGLVTVGDEYKAFRIASRLQPAGIQYADMIHRELSSPGAHWYPAAKTYVTENYLISVDKGLVFFRLSHITDIYTKTTEHPSMGGLTYLYQCAIGYSDGQAYDTHDVAIHSLQSQLINQYELQLEQIIEAVSAKNENVQIHVVE